VSDIYSYGEILGLTKAEHEYMLTLVSMLDYKFLDHAYKKIEQEQRKARQKQGRGTNVGRRPKN
jgi:hypothetical protein